MPLDNPLGPDAAMPSMTKKRRSASPDRAEDERAERLVPAVQRLPVVRLGVDGKITQIIRPAIVESAQWDDPDDLNDRAKKPRQVLGFRRTDPLAASAAQSGSPITKDHMVVAERYRDDFERGCLGARPGYERPEAGTGGAAASMGPSEMQLAALDRYRVATRAVGLRASWVLVEIVLGFGGIAETAERHGLTKRTAPGYVAGALDRLQEAYDEIGDERGGKNWC